MLIRLRQAWFGPVLPFLGVSALVALAVGACAPKAQEASFSSLSKFTVTAQNGVRLDLMDLKGKPVLLDIWASDCAACEFLMPRLQNMHDRFAEQGLRVIAVASESVELVNRYGEANGYTMLYADPEGRVQDALSVDLVPTTFLFDADGNLLKRWEGAHPMPEYLEALEEAGIETGAGMPDQR